MLLRRLSVCIIPHSHIFRTGLSYYNEVMPVKLQLPYWKIPF